MLTARLGWIIAVAAASTEHYGRAADSEIRGAAPGAATRRTRRNRPRFLDEHLKRIVSLARSDQKSFFERNPHLGDYRHRLLSIARCQGRAALPEPGSSTGSDTTRLRPPSPVPSAAAEHRTRKPIIVRFSTGTPHRRGCIVLANVCGAEPGMCRSPRAGRAHPAGWEHRLARAGTGVLRCRGAHSAVPVRTPRINGG